MYREVITAIPREPPDSVSTPSFLSVGQCPGRHLRNRFSVYPGIFVVMHTLVLATTGLLCSFTGIGFLEFNGAGGSHPHCQ